MDQASCAIERELQLNSRVAEIVLTAPDAEMYSGVLKLVLEVSGSRYGLFRYTDEDGTGAMVYPSTAGDVWNEHHAPGRSIKLPAKAGEGLWGRVLGKKKSFFVNHGFPVPEGYAPIDRILCVPVIDQGEIVGNLVVANKETDYGQDDIRLLEGIVCHFTPVLSARVQRDREEKQRKKAEDALRRSEELYRQFVEGTDDLVTQVDGQGRFTFVNHAARTIFGMEPDECVGRLAFDFVHSADEQRTQQWFTNCVRDRVSNATIENRQVGRKAQISHMIWNYNFRFDESGAVTGINGIAQDITEFKHSQEALRESNVALRAVLARIEDEKREIRESVMTNVEKVLMPTLRTLGNIVPAHQQKYVALLEEHLDNLTSSFGNRLSKAHGALTPVEIEICQLIRNGLSSKEIAKVRHVAPATVAKQRERIRKKLQVSGTATNLATHLRMLAPG